MGLFKDLANGLSGNLSKMDNDTIEEEYGQFLTRDEEILLGFKLVRDVIIVTDKRIIDLDKEGTTGKKMRVNYIDLSSVIHVSCETAGFGIDDSEINISYIASPYFKASGGVSVETKTFEFPKGYEITGLYRFLVEKAQENHEKINA